MRWQLHIPIISGAFRVLFSKVYSQCFCLLLLLGWAVAAPVNAEPEAATIRVGVLQYGTVRWELDVLQRHRLGQQHQLDIQVTPLASNQATLTALQSGAVDIIVGDWIWAARQRLLRRKFSFYPYSSSAASVMVAADSGIQTFADLRGKKVGVAGGPVNKSWVLYKAYARAQHEMDLRRDTVVKFAAPPILNELMLKGELDAVINFWHFSARLQEQGLRQLVSMDDVLASLGIDQSIPVLGWLFKTEWAQNNAAVLDRFIAASYQARTLLRNSDTEWQQLTPLKQVKSPALRTLLRDDYRRGIPQVWGAPQQNATRTLFIVLKQEAGAELAGSLTQLPDNLFWTNSVLPTQ